ncbi:hypothetical protein EYF80_043843 [Liparis tanakae]|uniref:Uncharacterized protein n=1 Tax=Liparis tanakae TaxID=230148 RepID=A0A4Z2G072_9TELE|nr:hypothetical protein EYF80_043843 [Liparis tanakae]
MTGGLFPRLPRKCRGDSIVPNSWKSPNRSLSVSVVAEIPASGPRLGREPAVTEGSGIRPGIASDSVVTTASSHREEMEDKLRLKQIDEKHFKKRCTDSTEPETRRNIVFCIVHAVVPCQESRGVEKIPRFRLARSAFVTIESLCEIVQVGVEVTTGVLRGSRSLDTDLYSVSQSETPRELLRSMSGTDRAVSIGVLSSKLGDIFSSSPSLMSREGSRS